MGAGGLSLFSLFSLLALAVPLGTGCQGTSSAGPDLSYHPWILESGDFTFLVNEDVTEAQLAPVVTALEENASRIMAHLGVAEMPHLTVARIGILRTLPGPEAIVGM